MDDPSQTPDEFFKDLQPESPAPKVPSLDIATLSRADVTLPDELIPGLLYRGTKMVIAGGSKSYKTWLLQHLGFCASHALPWLCFEPGRCHVAFVNLELKAPIFNHRLLEIQNALHVRPVPESFFVFHFRDAGVAPERLFESLMASVAFGVFDIIIIDPIYKLLGEKDENSARDMAGLMWQLETIAAQNNCAIVFGHHFPKGSSADKDPLDKLAGSGVFGRDLDTVITLTAHNEPLCFRGDFVLRNHRPLESIVFRWDFPLFKLEDALDPEEIKQPGRPSLYSAEDLFELIKAHNDDFTLKELQVRSHEELGLSRATFFRLWKKLQKYHRVFVSKISQTISIE